MQKPPENQQERKELHERLMQGARTAQHNGGTKGLRGLVKIYGDQLVAKQILQWFLLYTQIRLDHRHRVWQLSVPANLQGPFDLGPAALNPYYSVEVPTAAPNPLSFPKTVIPISERKSGLSDREFTKKTIRTLLGSFLDTPTRHDKQKLIALIESFDSVPILVRGSPFVSGGLPSLGKRG